MNKEKSVLVTGGAGYIGSHVVLACLDSGYKVIVIDRDKKACEHLQKCLSQRKKVKIFNADIGNDVYLDGIFKNENVGAIMHLAADASVPDSVDDPLTFYHNNTAKSISLLDKARKYGVTNFIFSCTAAVYGQPSDEICASISETQPCKPITPYGESKLMFETILKRYSEVNKNFMYSSLRYFNVSGNDIGNRVQDVQWRKKGNIIPKILGNIIDGRSGFNVYGTDLDTPDGSCIRDYVHVTDIANAHMICLEKQVKGVYNLGTNRGTSVWEIVREVVSVTGDEIDVTHSKPRQGDPKILVANPSRFIEKTGWEPAYNISEIIRTAYKAYRKIK